ncbi:MAG: hypothetical protein AB7P04_01220 [Bacteriovoracia bacterium]
MTIAGKKVASLALLAAVGASLAYAFAGSESDPAYTRTTASIAPNYESLSACEKQKTLWDNVTSTVHAKLPEYGKLGLPQVYSMWRQKISNKRDRFSDYAPEGWVKYLHRRGAMAQVKIVPRDPAHLKYTGVFQGAECALLRLSLTYRPAGDKPVAPGLALKVLRDGTPSANISALVSLDGQGKDFNFFAHPMSNIVPVGGSFGQKLVHRIFSSVSKYPEELLASDMALVDAHGKQAAAVVAPRQLFFVPGRDLKFSSDDHDVRDDFAKIPVGTTVYEIHALPAQRAGFDYTGEYTDELAVSFLKESEHIADVVTTSEFLASAFGDDGIFFKHQVRP